jgi:hypothetical protein
MLTKVKGSVLDYVVNTTHDLFGESYAEDRVVVTKGHLTEDDGNGGTYVYDATIDRSYADGFYLFDPTIRAYDQGFGTGTGCFVLQQDFPDHFQVGTDKVLLDPFKQKYYLRGAFAFDYLFVSQEARTDVSVRENSYSWSGIGVGTSPQTGYGRIQWRNHAYVETMLDRIQADGINTIKVGVDPAMLNAAGQDNADSNEYPCDMYMLSSIIYAATKRGMVTLLRQGRKDATASVFSTFMEHLIYIYKDNPYVWYNPENEINGGITNDVPTWISDMETYIGGMRGANAKSPIVINATQYGGFDGIDACYASMQSSSIISGDPNLIVGMHHYQAAADTDGFLGESKQDSVELAIQKLHKDYCLFIEEFGINNNLTGGEDPDINYGGVTGSYSTLWDTGAQEEYSKEFLRFCLREIRDGRMCGVMAITYSAYIPGTLKYPTNIIRKYGNDSDPNDGDITTWGTIFKNFLLKDWESIPKADGNRLVFDSGIYLRPYNGNTAVIGDEEYLIPEAGINLSSTGVTQDVLRYAYLYKDTDGLLKLEASADAPVRDPATGNWVKAVATSTTGGTGNTFDAPTHSLVGLVYKTAAGFVSDADQRLVRSWWNRSDLFMEGVLSANDSKAAVIELIDNLQLECLLWPDEYIWVSAGAKFTVTTGTTAVTFRIEDNASTVQPEQIRTTPVNETHFAFVTVPIGSSTAAYHDIQVHGGTTGNSAEFKSGGRVYGLIKGN